MREMGGRGNGKNRKYNDDYHKAAREIQKLYSRDNREAYNLAHKENITMAEARKRLGIKPPKRAKHGSRVREITKKMKKKK